MSLENTVMTHTDDIERHLERWRYYACLRRQREDNESKNIQLARGRANYSIQRQQTLGGENVLVGSLANLNEDLVHSNPTSTNPSLILPNHEVGQSFRLTHICNLACNMPVMQSYARSMVRL